MDDNTAETGSVSSQESYAFLNHSPDTLHNNLPPNIDKKDVARQKRKRTSPEDQVVLEAAYSRDPKPDKAARLELVKQVALGEKEVQIWFQNRRQSSRRKARPLLPHEVAQYQMSRAGLATSSPESHSVSADPGQYPTSTREVSSSEVPPLGTPAIGPQPPTYPTPGFLRPSLEPASALSQVVDNLQNARDGASNAHSEVSAPAKTYSSMNHVVEPATVGYLANRRSVSSRMSDPSLYGEHAMAGPGRRLKKSASVVRLSLNAEGKAEIVTKNVSSPSPPRPQQAPSMTGTNTPAVGLAFPPLPAVKNLQRSSSGRSRDSRSWEFWCDKEARSELGNAAAKDSSGSAAGAIGLLRTASGRSVLGSLSSKRNFAPSRQQHESVKRTKLGHRRPQLQRSHTSLGRLQGKTDGPVFEGARPKLKHSESAASVQLKGTDSDKENWSPGPEANIDDTRQVRGRHQRGGASENIDPEGDAELAAFMGGSRKRAAASEHDDLDCIQGLLSLSQGNWR